MLLFEVSFILSGLSIFIFMVPVEVDSGDRTSKITKQFQIYSGNVKSLILNLNKKKTGLH